MAMNLAKHYSFHQRSSFYSLAPTLKSYLGPWVGAVLFNSCMYSVAKSLLDLLEASALNT